MKLIIGLGNVGEKYKNTRHNVGWLVLDKLKQGISKSELLISKKVPIPEFLNNKKLQSLITSHQSLILAKPQTFMNNSGEAVQKLVSFYNVQSSDLWVIHDDLDIKLGQYKIQFGVGPKVHNGLNSIDQALGTRQYWHVRVGVDNRDKSRISNIEYRISGTEYVLQNFTEEEMVVLDSVVKNVCIELVSKLN